MAVVLAAVITLVGTLAIGAIGFGQWRRTQSVSEQKEYQSKRAETLKVLWEALTEIEEEQRTGLMTRGLTTQPLQQNQVRRVNLLLLKSAPFLLEDEREWSISIVQYIIEIDTALRVHKIEGKPDADWWITSVMQPPAINVTSDAAYRLNHARQALADRYASVMKGEHN
jgi:hypothetical protein